MPTYEMFEQRMNEMIEDRQRARREVEPDEETYISRIREFGHRIHELEARYYQETLNRTSGISRDINPWEISEALERREPAKEMDEDEAYRDRLGVEE